MSVPTTSSPPRRRSRSVRASTWLDDLLRDEAREHVADALPLERSDRVVRADRADRREHERAERVRERDHPALLERGLRRDGESDADGDGEQDRRDEPQPEAGHRREEAEDDDQREHDPLGQSVFRCAARSARFVSVRDGRKSSTNGSAACNPRVKGA